MRTTNCYHIENQRHYRKVELSETKEDHPLKNDMANQGDAKGEIQGIKYPPLTLILAFRCILGLRID